VTTEAVPVEAAHAVHRHRGPAFRVLESLISNGIPIVATHLPPHEACVHVMRRYADTPMDYADATLVAPGDRLRLSRVFTWTGRGSGPVVARAACRSC
jgi:hypothetical protein